MLAHPVMSTMTANAMVLTKGRLPGGHWPTHRDSDQPLLTTNRHERYPKPVATVPTPLRVAITVVMLQAAALTVIAAIVLVKTVIGHPDNVARAVLDALLALFGAAVLAACARGLVHLRPAARSQVVVIELLTAVVSFSLGFQAGLIQYGGPLMLSAVVVLYLLFTPPVRAVLDRHYD